MGGRPGGKSDDALTGLQRLGAAAPFLYVADHKHTDIHGVWSI